jgi:hypothetical protein
MLYRQAQSLYATVLCSPVYPIAMQDDKESPLSVACQDRSLCLGLLESVLVLKLDHEEIA